MGISSIFNKVKLRIKELGKLTPIALITAFLPMSGSFVLVIVGYPLGNWLRENSEAGLPAYFLGVLIFCGLALIPTNLIGVLGGWAFGFVVGLAALMLGIVGAAYISFLIHKRITGRKLPDLTEKYPKAQAIYDELVNDSLARSTLVIFLIRASVIMPFAFTNFLLGSAHVSSFAYIIGTFFGMLPRSAAMAFTGAGLAELDLENPTEAWVIVLGVLASIVMIIVVSIFSRRALEKMTAHA